MCIQLMRGQVFTLEALFSLLMLVGLLSLVSVPSAPHAPSSILRASLAASDTAHVLAINPDAQAELASALAGPDHLLSARLDRLARALAVCLELNLPDKTLTAQCIEGFHYRTQARAQRTLWINGQWVTFTVTAKL